MPYILQLTQSNGAYRRGAMVARQAGITGQSYTYQLQSARVFPTREAAERERCEGNETIVDVDQILRG